MKKGCCDHGVSSKKEDRNLKEYTAKHGDDGHFPNPAGVPSCGKSCRLRGINDLKPNVKRRKLGDDEEDLIIRLHALLGNRWSLIAGRLPGRTDDEVENYWNSHIKKKVLKNGIDPNNYHRVSCNNSHCPAHNSASVAGITMRKERVSWKLVTYTKK